MIIKFECVFQDERLAEVPEASHLVLIDFRTRVRILTVPSVKLQVPQPTLHLLFFFLKIFQVFSLAEKAEQPHLGVVGIRTLVRIPAVPSAAILASRSSWTLYVEDIFAKKISGELLPETGLKFSAHSKKKSTPQNNEQNYHVFRISIKFPSAHRELYSTTETVFLD